MVPRLWEPRIISKGSSYSIHLGRRLFVVFVWSEKTYCLLELGFSLRLIHLKLRVLAPAPKFCRISGNPPLESKFDPRLLLRIGKSVELRRTTSPGWHFVSENRFRI